MVSLLLTHWLVRSPAPLLRCMLWCQKMTSIEILAWMLTFICIFLSTAFSQVQIHYDVTWIGYLSNTTLSKIEICSLVKEAVMVMIQWQYFLLGHTCKNKCLWTHQAWLLHCLMCECATVLYAMCGFNVYKMRCNE